MSSLADQYHARQAAKAEQLDALGEALAGSFDPIGPEPTPLHLAAVGMLDRLIEMADAMTGAPGDETPMPIRVGLQFMTKFRPSLVEMFARVDEESVRGFLTAMRDDLQGVLDTPGIPSAEGSASDGTSEGGAAAAVGADLAGADQPSA